MNKDLMGSLEQRAKEFGARTELADDVRIEVVLHGGRVYALERVVEARDDTVQFDATDPAAEDQRVSVLIPYHQIAQVLFQQRKERRGAGFRF